jgi:hypothetical protein
MFVPQETPPQLVERGRSLVITAATPMIVFRNQVPGARSLCAAASISWRDPCAQLVASGGPLSSPFVTVLQKYIEHGVWRPGGPAPPD